MQNVQNVHSSMGSVLSLSPFQASSKCPFRAPSSTESVSPLTINTFLKNLF